MKDHTVVSIYSPIGIGIRNDFAPTGTTSTCPPQNTRDITTTRPPRPILFPPSAISACPAPHVLRWGARTDTHWYMEGCKTVLLVDQYKLGFGNQTDSRRTG